MGKSQVINTVCVELHLFNAVHFEMYIAVVAELSQLNCRCCYSLVEIVLLFVWVSISGIIGLMEEVP